MSIFRESYIYAANNGMFLRDNDEVRGSGWMRAQRYKGIFLWDF